MESLDAGRFNLVIASREDAVWSSEVCVGDANDVQNRGSKSFGNEPQTQCMARKLLSNQSPIWGMCLTRTAAFTPRGLFFLGFHSKRRGDSYSLAGRPVSSKGAGPIFFHGRCDLMWEGETQWENF